MTDDTRDRISIIGRITILTSESERSGEEAVEVATADLRALLDSHKRLTAENERHTILTRVKGDTMRDQFEDLQRLRALAADQAATIREWRATVGDMLRRPEDHRAFPIADWLIYSHEHGAW
jgi:hypothetical protein